MTKVESQFARFVSGLGYNKREISKAAKLLGKGSTWASERMSGKKKLTICEEFAMTAIRAGLPRISQTDDKTLDAIDTMIKAAEHIKFKTSDINGGSDGSPNIQK